MAASPPTSWKVILTAALLLAVCASVLLRAPRQRIGGRELKWLVASAVVLYGVGAAASLRHRAELAGFVYAAGILVCALAVWLSRGSSRGDGGDGPDGAEPPVDSGPSPQPDGLPPLDWGEFERARARWGRERVSG
jgi:hypothetical protein